jgi:glucose dehydrogenase
MDSARSQVIILYARTLVGSLVWTWPEIVFCDYVFRTRGADLIFLGVNVSVAHIERSAKDWYGRAGYVIANWP